MEISTHLPGIKSSNDTWKYEGTEDMRVDSNPNGHGVVKNIVNCNSQF